jgi:sugar-specific transcriptional regulator TrmB
MDRDRSVESLVRLGLTSYEARAYLALTRRDSFSAAEVARLANLPRQRIYDVLSGLVDRGLAATHPGRAIRYSATHPKLAMEQLLTAHRRHLAELEAGADAMSEDLASVYRAGQSHSDPLEYIEVLRDPGAIRTRFHELEGMVKKEILVFNKPPYATPVKENVAGLELAKGHLARGIYEFSLFDNPAEVEAVREFIHAGESARFVRELPLKLVIIDETIVMFGMQDPVAGRSNLTIMVVEHPSLASVLRTAFNAYWAEGLAFEDAARLASRPDSKTG